MSIESYTSALSHDGDVNLPLLVFIHGYCQTGQETWSETVSELRRTGVPNQCLIIERKFGERAGRMTVGEQLQELRNYIAALREQSVINRKVIWVGHSFAGVMADDLAANFMRDTAGVITLAPVPTTGWWIFFNLSFWLRGGLISLPSVVWSVLTGQSVRYPPGMVRGLFAGATCSDKRFQALLQVQQADSGWVFPQVLFSYWLDSQVRERVSYLGRGQRRLMIGCRQDQLIRTEALRQFAEQTGTRLAWVDRAHCWWLSDEGIADVAFHMKTAITKMNS